MTQKITPEILKQIEAALYEGDDSRAIRIIAAAYGRPPMVKDMDEADKLLYQDLLDEEANKGR